MPSTRIRYASQSQLVQEQDNDLEETSADAHGTLTPCHQGNVLGKDSGAGVDWHVGVNGANGAQRGKKPPQHLIDKVRKVKAARRAAARARVQRAFDWGARGMPPRFTANAVRLTALNWGASGMPQRFPVVSEQLRCFDWGGVGMPQIIPAEPVQLTGINWGVTGMPHNFPREVEEITPVDWSVRGVPRVGCARLAFLVRA